MSMPPSRASTSSSLGFSGALAAGAAAPPAAAAAGAGKKKTKRQIKFRRIFRELVWKQICF
jgi:hypothetical protein